MTDKHQECFELATWLQNCLVAWPLCVFNSIISKEGLALKSVGPKEKNDQSIYLFIYLSSIDVDRLVDMFGCLSYVCVAPDF